MDINAGEKQFLILNTPGTIVCAGGCPLFPAERSRLFAGRFFKGATEARLGTQGCVRAVGHNDGGTRSPTGKARAAASGCGT